MNEPTPKSKSWDSWEKTADEKYARRTVLVMSTDLVIIDDNANGYKYIGTAPQGSAAAASAWAITRIDNSNPQTIDHSQPLQIWNDRTSVTYS